MKRIATLLFAGALVLAVSTTASAQLNLSFGRGGTTLSFGQPAYGYGGYGYGYNQPGYIGAPYSGYAYPNSAYSAYGISPYTTGTTTYSSAYRGYVAPGTTVIQQRTYTTLPYSYGTSYPYSGYASPYGYNYGYRGGYNYGYQGVPLIRGNGFSVNLVPR